MTDHARTLLAVVPVRSGVLPAGGAEAVAECGGATMLAGSALDPTALVGVASAIDMIELGPFQPARWAEALAPLVCDWRVVVLPGSPDGRDLAPRVAHRLGRPLLAGATQIDGRRARLVRDGGLTLLDVAIDEPVVATLQPGVRGVVRAGGGEVVAVTLQPPAAALTVAEPALVAELTPDVATMELGEAARIVAGGAGLDGPERFGQLADVAFAVGAAMGATRVVTDRGWLGHERQIGTTGVVVDPELYIAFGISGAVQHIAGLGMPAHILSVNTDPHCPMMTLADLAVVADANAVIDELQHLLVGARPDG